jgi:hypothetical protein
MSTDVKSYTGHEFPVETLTVVWYVGTVSSEEHTDTSFRVEIKMETGGSPETLISTY